MHNLGIVFSIIGVIHTHQYCSLANQQRILEPLHASCLAEEKAEMWRPAVFSRSLVLFTPPTLGEPEMPNQLWRRCLDPEITQTSVFFPLKLTLPSELVLIKGPGREQTFPHLQFTVSRASHRTAHLPKNKSTFRSTLLCNTSTCCHIAFMLCLHSPYMHKSTAEKTLYHSTSMLRGYLSIWCPLETHALIALWMLDHPCVSKSKLCPCCSFHVP